MSRKLSAEGHAFIEREEGKRYKVYLCSAGKPTCGIGHTGRDVTMADYEAGRTVDEAQVQKWFSDDVAEFEDTVNRVLTRRPRQEQFDAMVSLAFNIGSDAFVRKCSVWRKFNRDDDAAAARTMLLWNKETVNGKLRVNRGLDRRRVREAALFATKEGSHYTDGPMSQAPEGESSLASSPINRVASGVGGVSALGAVSELVGTSGTLKDQLASFGQYAIPLALVVVAGLCAYVMWQRYQQREGGWA